MLFFFYKENKCFVPIYSVKGSVDMLFCMWGFSILYNYELSPIDHTVPYLFSQPTSKYTSTFLSFSLNQNIQIYNISSQQYPQVAFGCRNISYITVQFNLVLSYQTGLYFHDSIYITFLLGKNIVILVDYAVNFQSAGI